MYTISLRSNVASDLFTPHLFFQTAVFQILNFRIQHIYNTTVYIAQYYSIASILGDLGFGKFTWYEDFPILQGFIQVKTSEIIINMTLQNVMLDSFKLPALHGDGAELIKIKNQEKNINSMLNNLRFCVFQQIQIFAAQNTIVQQRCLLMHLAPLLFVIFWL
ncbi:hypothetical protein ACJX0J_037907, partial [Zea mays]